MAVLHVEQNPMQIQVVDCMPYCCLPASGDMLQAVVSNTMNACGFVNNDAWAIMT